MLTRQEIRALRRLARRALKRREAQERARLVPALDDVPCAATTDCAHCTCCNSCSARRDCGGMKCECNALDDDTSIIDVPIVAITAQPTEPPCGYCGCTDGYDTSYDGWERCRSCHGC